MFDKLALNSEFLRNLTDDLLVSPFAKTLKQSIDPVNKSISSGIKNIVDELGMIGPIVAAGNTIGGIGGGIASGLVGGSIGAGAMYLTHRTRMEEEKKQHDILVKKLIKALTMNR